MMEIGKVMQNHIARIEEKKTILSEPEVLQALTKVETIAAKAAIGNRIAQYPEQDLANRVAMMILLLVKDLGIRITEDSDFKYYSKRFLETLRDYYSNLTLEQVEKAFQLLQGGDLDEWLPKDKNGMPDRNHYQVFSVEFICKVLRAFQSYNNKIWTKAQKAIPEPEKVWSKEEIDEAYEGVWNDILAKFQIFKNEVILSDFTAPSISVRVLQQKGKIVEICAVSDADIKKSFYVIQGSNAISVFDKSEIRKNFESGKIHQRHFVEAERLRDLRIIREVFENEKEL